MIDFTTNNENNNEAPAAKLEEVTIGVALKCTAFGNNRKIGGDAVSEMANTQEAEASSISASKKLIDNSEAHGELRAIINRAKKYWKAVTLPHVDSGVRLIHKDRLAAFSDQLDVFKAELEVAKHDLAAELDDIRQEAKERLGNLYNPSDYPEGIPGEFSVNWETREITISDSWKELAPEVYQAQVEAAQAKLMVCVQEAEQEFAEQLADAVQKIAQNLNGNDDGELKTFGPSNLERVKTAVERFKTLNISNNAELDAVFAKAEAVIEGKTAKGIKKDAILRNEMKQAVNKLADDINGMSTAKVKRKIKVKRPAKQASQEADRNLLNVA